MLVPHKLKYLLSSVSYLIKIFALNPFIFGPVWFLLQSQKLSDSLSKSGLLDFGTKNNFPSYFVSEKGLAHIHKKAIYYFPVSYFCFATSENCILAELRLPSVIRKVKFTDFVKRATSLNVPLTPKYVFR